MNIPKHIAIIMDGNGRWAEARGLPKVLGHKQGVESVRKVVKACLNTGVKYLTLYAFSTENWSRPDYEVKALFKLLENFIDNEFISVDYLSNLFVYAASCSQKNMPELLGESVSSEDLKNITNQNNTSNQS